MVNVVRSTYNFQSNGIIDVRNLVSVGGTFPFRTDDGAIRLIDPIAITTADPNILNGAFDSFSAVSQNIRAVDPSGTAISGMNYKLVDSEDNTEIDITSDGSGDFAEAIVDLIRYERITDTDSDNIALTPYTLSQYHYNYTLSLIHISEPTRPY